ncbi:MAG TPA: alpha-amylase family glycosyl hydrolase [Polyangia bacterium]|nr:alpha-amylase family glycosyl hydrolase [Polyangia bacterium]
MAAALSLLLIGCKGEPAPTGAALWRRQVLYLLITDRFQNGKTSNDGQGRSDCLDPTDPYLYHGGDLEGVRQRLGYLQELGVTTLWTSPLYKQVGPHTFASVECSYHGYFPDFANPNDGAIEPKLGDEADLDLLLGDLAKKDMRLLFDMIVNHAGFDARVTQTNPDWFHPYPACEQGNLETMCLFGLPDFAQEKPEVATYLTDLSARWVRRFPIGGIRLDTTRLVPIDYLSQNWLPAMRQARDPMFVLGEVYDDQSIDTYNTYLSAGFDSVFNFVLQRSFVSSFGQGQSVDAVATSVEKTLSTLGLERALLVVNFLDNHDLTRLMSNGGSDTPDQQAMRYRLGLTALMTLPGTPQLYYGDEVGALGAYPQNRADMPAWAFAAGSRGGSHPGFLPGADATFQHTTRLVSLRRSHPALFEGYYSELWRQNGGSNPNVYAFFRGSGKDRIVVVINNSLAASGRLAIPLQINPVLKPEDKAALGDGARFVELLGSGAPASVSVANGSFVIDLPALAAGVYQLGR